MIIDIKYLTENVVNEELYELCTSSADKVQRYLNIVENKIKLYLDIEQFKENDEYIFPEDLKEVVRFLVESLYLNKTLNPTGWARSSYTEKHDDYSLSETFTGGENLMRYGIPILADYLRVLRYYRGENQTSPSGRFIV